MTEGTRVDLHAKVLDEHVAARARRRGLDGLVYAPHFTRWPTVRERAARFSDEDLLVIPARELFTGSWRDRRHVLALDLEAPIPDFLTLEGTMAELERQDAVVLAPHPTYATVSLDHEHVGSYRDLLDGVEVYNAKYLPRHRRRSRAIADAFDLPTFASSYAHLQRSVGEIWTTLERPVETEAELLAALRDGAPRHVSRRDGPRHAGRRALELSHLLWENSWQKIDRVFLSGTAPTHPGHVAYEGRFDDVRVY